MLFDGSSIPDGSTGDGLRRRMTIAAQEASEHDYSHLLDCPVEQEEVQRTGFDALLSDYDRVLLRFGMHILWES
ncbi:MAG TPA: hypothetical protein VMB19_03770 [Silvibacterium sp.]|nr:hypothetical protein [Silvibacterium sp.]